MTRRPAAVLTVLLGLLALGAGPAQAAEQGYRYWSFWERDGGSWTYATQGPATQRPIDGDVLGFRFSVSENSADGSKPRNSEDFAAICEGVAEKAGSARVALVLDYGVGQDAPGGETPPRPRTDCAVIADDGTAADALATVAKPLRYNSDALLCAIDGYPERGCGEAVDAGTGADTDTDTGDARADAPAGKPAAEPAEDDGVATGTGTAVGAAAVLALAGGAALVARRRRED